MSQFDIDLDNYLSSDERFGTFSADEYVGEKRGYWRLADGTLVAIKSMSDAHIERTLAMIARMEPDFKYGRVYQALQRQLSKRRRQRRQ